MASTRLAITSSHSASEGHAIAQVGLPSNSSSSSSSHRMGQGNGKYASHVWA